MKNKFFFIYINMSWGSCLSGSNNIHFDFPPLMSDGRNFSSWTPACSLNEKIQEQAHIKSNWNYRQYLIKNADQLMISNRLSACNNCCSCWNQYNTPPVKHVNKFIYESCLDKRKPYGYEESDLKSVYLSRNELNSQLIAPILTQEQYLKLNK
tara:strand:+ start:281 stop:739 length:459 start_codon:yes stop_codon:yes gene_type:complete